MLVDFEAVKAKYEALGQTGVELIPRDEGDDGSVTMVTRRVVPMDLPGSRRRCCHRSNT